MGSQEQGEVWSLQEEEEEAEEERGGLGDAAGGTAGLGTGKVSSCLIICEVLTVKHKILLSSISEKASTVASQEEIDEEEEVSTQS